MISCMPGVRAPTPCQNSILSADPCSLSVLCRFLMSFRDAMGVSLSQIILYSMLTYLFSSFGMAEYVDGRGT